MSGNDYLSANQRDDLATAASMGDAALYAQVEKIIRLHRSAAVAIVASYLRDVYLAGLLGNKVKVTHVLTFLDGASTKVRRGI